MGLRQQGMLRVQPASCCRLEPGACKSQVSWPNVRCQMSPDDCVDGNYVLLVRRLQENCTQLQTDERVTHCYHTHTHMQSLQSHAREHFGNVAPCAVGGNLGRDTLGDCFDDQRGRHEGTYETFADDCKLLGSKSLFLDA